jgi:hypothetical protein
MPVSISRQLLITFNQFGYADQPRRFLCARRKAGGLLRWLRLVISVRLLRPD